MKILLLNAPWSGQGLYGVRAGSRWPHLEDSSTSNYMSFPFFMAYAAAVLERSNKCVYVIDACAERLDDHTCLQRIITIMPDLVVIETATPTIDIDIQFASKLKHHLPGLKVAFCGPHAPMSDREFLEIHRDVEFVLCGEYEMILLDLVNMLEGRMELSKVKGLIYRNSKGEVICNDRGHSLVDLDTLPWPARHLFNMSLYCDRPGGIPHPSLTLLSSRGCPFRCAFCVWPQVMYGGNRYRVRNPVDVVDEIEYCVKRWHFKSFYFDDDTFNVGRERILHLSAEIRSRRIGLPWAVMARADLADAEILRAMKSAGLVAIKYGVESGVQALIDASGKNLKIEQVEEAVRTTKELGIQVHLTFTLGLPGENRSTIEKTIRKAIELDPYSVQFSIATPFPGTSYYSELKSKGWIVANSWEDYSGSTGAVHRTENLTEEDLNNALITAYSEWNRYCITKPSHWPYLTRTAIQHPKAAMLAVIRIMNKIVHRGSCTDN